MKPILYAGVATVMIAAASVANAQSVGVGVGPVGVGVDFAPEQRTVIREYVTRERVRPVEFRERVTVGATLPADVEISTVPAEWGPTASRYRYVYSGNRVYFVEPSSRRVIHILD